MPKLECAAMLKGRARCHLFLILIPVPLSEWHLPGAGGSSGGHSTLPGNCPHPGVPSYPSLNLLLQACGHWNIIYIKVGILAFVFFLMRSIFKVFLNLLQYCFCSRFWFSGHEACGILAPRPGVKPVLPVWKGKISCTGPLGKSLGVLALSALSLLYPSNWNQPVALSKYWMNHWSFWTYCKLSWCQGFK